MLRAREAVSGAQFRKGPPIEYRDADQQRARDLAGQMEAIGSRAGHHRRSPDVCGARVSHGSSCSPTRKPGPSIVDALRAALRCRARATHRRRSRARRGRTPRAGVRARASRRAPRFALRSKIFKATTCSTAWRLRAATWEGMPPMSDAWAPIFSSVSTRPAGGRTAPRAPPAARGSWRRRRPRSCPRSKRSPHHSDYSAHSRAVVRAQEAMAGDYA